MIHKDLVDAFSIDEEFSWLNLWDLGHMNHIGLSAIMHQKLSLIIFLITTYQKEMLKYTSTLIILKIKRIMKKLMMINHFIVLNDKLELLEESIKWITNVKFIDLDFDIQDTLHTNKIIEDSDKKDLSLNEDTKTSQKNISSAKIKAEKYIKFIEKEAKNASNANVDIRTYFTHKDIFSFKEFSSEAYFRWFINICKSNTTKKERKKQYKSITYKSSKTTKEYYEYVNSDEKTNISFYVRNLNFWYDQPNSQITEIVIRQCKY